MSGRLAEMARIFNIAGPCVVEDHYMLPAEARCADLKRLMDEKLFFVIHAARQSGKTTLLASVERALNAGSRYHALYCSLESAQQIEDPEKGVPAICAAIGSALRQMPGIPRLDFMEGARPGAFNVLLKDQLIGLCERLTKPLVVLFDEVDCLSEGTLLSFLRQLYVNRVRAPFVHSLALVGMRNIRDYQSRVRPNRETLGSASPFNIVSESLTLRNFTQDEVAALYAQHTADCGQAFAPALVERAFFWTQGQPWLVNAIAREIVEKICDRDCSRKIEPWMADDAAQRIILRRDTHIDSLMERLKEERVRRVVEPVILGEDRPIDLLSDDCQYVQDLGLLKLERGALLPSNRIYREVIARALTFSAQCAMETTMVNRWMDEQSLDMDGLLREFQRFWRENGEMWAARHDYKEAGPHLILQAFLQRVVNGGASVSREFALGRARLDLCVTHAGQSYAVEVKLWRSEKTATEGLEQIGAYMAKAGAKDGWLVIFDRRADVPWEQRLYWKEIQQEGRRIRLVGC